MNTIRHYDSSGRRGKPAPIPRTREEVLRRTIRRLRFLQPCTFADLHIFATPRAFILTKGGVTIDVHHDVGSAAEHFLKLAESCQLSVVSCQSEKNK